MKTKPLYTDDSVELIIVPTLRDRIWHLAHQILRRKK